MIQDPRIPWSSTCSAPPKKTPKNTISRSIPKPHWWVTHKFTCFPFVSVLQETPSAQAFFEAAIHFLSQAHAAREDPTSKSLAMAVVPDYEAAWADIRELWFLGMQAFASCMTLFPWLPYMVLQSSWPQDLLALLGQVAPDSVDFELIAVFQGILLELARASQQGKEVIMSQRGKEWANLYGMAALEQCLCEL